MLNAAIKNHCGFGKHSSILYVGDRDDDEAAALAASIPFMWAIDWWNSAPKAPVQDCAGA